MTSRGGRIATPRRAVAARSAFAAGLLGEACAIGAAVPLSGSLAAAVVCVAAGCAALGTVRLWLGPPAEATGFAGPAERIGSGLAGLVRQTPWAEITVVAVLVLEALHRSRPWHTALLGAALLAYLLAVHLAESRSRPAVLRPQLPLLAAGLGLLLLAACASLLPAATGSAAGLMAVLAGLAAIAVGCLALTR
jgi:hypothetical protein